MRAIDAWQLDDGRIFDDEDEAIYEERRMKRKEKLYPVIRGIYGRDTVSTAAGIVEMILDSWEDIEEAMKL